MRTIDAKTLKDIIEKHGKWVRGDTTGERADLRSADLSGADLRSAYLRSADLSGADLSGADLRSADLSGANLRSANLRSADLRSADLGEEKDKIIERRQICPQEGSFIAWKSLDGGIAKLEIPADAKRLGGAIGRKCRAEFAKVLAIFDYNGTETTTPLRSKHDRNFLYAVGQTVKPDSFDPDAMIECSNGIHFFMTRLEAQEY